MKAVNILEATSDSGLIGGKLDEIVVHDGEMIEYEIMERENDGMCGVAS